MVSVSLSHAMSFILRFACILMNTALYLSPLQYSYAIQPPWATPSASSTRVELNHNPQPKDFCDFELYQEFFKFVKVAREENKYEIIGRKFATHSQQQADPTKEFFMDPKVLCIRTDEKGNIDINQWDCVRKQYEAKWRDEGICVCGHRWSTIDLTDKESYLGLNPITYSYEYQATIGLNKDLVTEKNLKSGRDECVASRLGHCSLGSDDGAQNFTRCMKGFKCSNKTVLSPVVRRPLYIPRTGNWYGICVSEATSDEIESPFSGSWKSAKIELRTVAYVLTSGLFVFKIIFI